MSNTECFLGDNGYLRASVYSTVLPDDLEYDTSLVIVFLFTAMTFSLPPRHIITFAEDFLSRVFLFMFFLM